MERYGDIKLVLKSERMSTETKEKITKVSKIISLILIYIFLAFFAVLVIFPFYWMLITALKSGDEIQSLQPTFWPETIMWSNYSVAITRLDFATLLGNTIFVGLVETIGTLITTIFAAFAFARLEFKGKNALFALLLATMMIPGEMMVISNYTSVSLLGMTASTAGKYAAIMLPFMTSVFYIYLLRQNFKQIPNELYLAAKVDGKSDWAFLWKVMVPLAAPTLITIFILKLMGAWNSYVWPNLIAGGSQNVWLITNGLRNAFSTTTNYDEYGYQMAATVLVTVPLLILFILFRKYIMRGMGRAGIKG